MKSKCVTCGLEFNISDLAYWDYHGFYCEVETMEEVEEYSCKCDSCMMREVY